MGSDSSGDGNRSGAFLSRIADALENRVVMLVVASVIGAGGGVGIVKTTPMARSDSFTGAMGRALEERIRNLEKLQTLDDQHRIDSVSGYSRIRNVEAQCTDCAARLRGIEDRTQTLEQARARNHGIRQ